MRENVIVKGSSFFVSGALSATVLIVLISLIPNSADFSEVFGETRFSSHPSSHRPGTSKSAVPSTRVIARDGESTRTSVRIRPAVRFFGIRFTFHSWSCIAWDWTSRIRCAKCCKNCDLFLFEGCRAIVDLVMEFLFLTRRVRTQWLFLFRRYFRLYFVFFTVFFWILVTIWRTIWHGWLVRYPIKSLRGFESVFQKAEEENFCNLECANSWSDSIRKQRFFGLMASRMCLVASFELSFLS